MPLARLVLFAATIGVLLMTGQAVLGHVPPLGVSIGVAAVYLGLVLSGVFALRLRMFVDAVIEGPRGARGWALTFDDGPDPSSTPGVLDALDAARVKATFFVIARKAEAHPDLVREILRRGHAVGLHSYAHDRFLTLRRETRVRADLEKGIEVLTAITGERPTLFRPPIGHTNPVVARVVEDLELVTVGWSVSARDGLAGVSAERVAARVSSRLRDGAIVLMHDASERGTHAPVAASILEQIVEAGREARMDVVPLAPWVAPMAATG
ncbi:MAG TPA: polysaccharide deacetylase family protein [Polyangiaceae bacterium]